MFGGAPAALPPPVSADTSETLGEASDAPRGLMCASGSFVEPKEPPAGPQPHVGNGKDAATGAPWSFGERGGLWVTPRGPVGFRFDIKNVRACERAFLMQEKKSPCGVEKGGKEGGPEVATHEPLACGSSQKARDEIPLGNSPRPYLFPCFLMKSGIKHQIFAQNSYIEDYAVGQQPKP